MDDLIRLSDIHLQRSDEMAIKLAQLDHRLLVRLTAAMEQEVKLSKRRNADLMPGKLVRACSEQALLVPSAHLDDRLRKAMCSIRNKIRLPMAARQQDDPGPCMILLGNGPIIESQRTRSQVT